MEIFWLFVIVFSVAAPCASISDGEINDLIKNIDTSKLYRVLNLTIAHPIDFQLIDRYDFEDAKRKKGGYIGILLHPWNHNFPESSWDELLARERARLRHKMKMLEDLNVGKRRDSKKH